MAGYGSGPGYESSMAASNLLGEGISWLWGKLTGSWDSYKKAQDRTKMTQQVINAYNGYDKPMQSNGARYRGAYFSGLSGLSSQERDSWTKKYLNEIKGLDQEGKDNVFRNKLFTEQFQNSKNPADQEIWKNRKSLTIDQRDALYAQKAVGSDLDEMSDFKEKPMNLFGTLTSPAYASKLGYVKGQKTLREQASDFLDSKAEQLMPQYEQAFSQLDGKTKQKMVEDLDSLSTSSSNYYKQYKGTDKLNLDQSQMQNLAAKYQAWTQVGGQNFANKQLNKFYQDAVANNQSLWEKTINSGAQFIDSATGMLIRGAGMAAGLLGMGKGADDKNDSYWDNIIDNDITRYGDRVATTNTYDPEEQKKLEKLGMSDNQIVNTQDQQNSLFSANTPFELLGQYGFTTASTLLSFGGSAVVNGLTKGAGWLGKAATAGKGLNATERGMQIARNLIKAKDIGNFMVVGGISTIEGGMNAAQTKRDTYDALSTDIDNKWSQRAQQDVATRVKQNPAAAASLLHSLGYDIQGTLSKSKEGRSKVIYTNDDINRMVQMLSNDDTTIAKYKEAHQKDIDEDKKAAASSAETAMYMDFVGNSIINGFIHSTLQNTLNAPKVQATMRKWGLAKSPLEKEGVSLSQAADGTWKATAKEYTKRAAFKDRLKESLGEGIEEYTQDLSSSFGQGYATDKMRQYINNKYNLHKDGSKALDTDILSGVVAGLSSVGQEAISAEAIKDGLYGGLSTFMGGLNANSHVLSGTRGSAQRQEGESAFDYMSRRNLVGWRSGITPLFSNKETNEVNQQRQQLADNVNKFFSDKNTQDAFFGLTNTSNWMKIQQEAAQHGDEKGVRDAKLGTLVSNVNTLNSLKGTAYYDAVLASLQQRANLNQDNLQDQNSIESQLVSQYKSNLQNKDSEVSDTEALDQIKKSSQGMLSTIQNVENESKEVEKLYGSTIDKDVKESMIFNRLAINDSKDRMDQLDKEISQVQSALGDGETTPISNGAKNLISQFGSISNAEKHVESLNSQIEDTKKQIEDFKNKKGDEDNDPKTQQAKSYILQIGQMRLDQLMQEKKAVSKQIETHRDNLSSDVVLTAKDIMSLDPQARATMLDPKNKDKYSKEQQDEIDKVNSVGIQQFSDFQSKIQDRGSLQEDYEGAMKGQLSLMQNPEMFNAYTNSVKQKAAQTLLQNKYSYLNDYEQNGDYSSFAQDLDKVFNSQDSNSQKAVESMLNGQNSAYFERYKKDRKTLEDLFTQIGESGSLENMDSNDAGMLAHTLTYLSNNGVDLKDESSVVQALSAQDEEGNSLLQKYVEDVNQNSPEDEKVAFTSVGEAIQSFKDVMDSYNKQEEEKVNNSKPIEAAPTQPEHAAPAQTSFAQMASASTEESDKKNKTQETQEEKPVSEFEVNSNKKVADAANLGSKVIANSSNTYSSEAKRIAQENLNSLGKNEFEDEHELSEALTKKATNLETQDEEDNGDKSQAASLLRQAASKIEASTVAPISAEAVTTKQNVFSRTSENATRTANPNANAMDTLNIAYIKSKYPNGALAKYLDQYKVEDFLRSDFMSDNPPIMFISDPQLAQDIQQELKSKGYNYTQDNIPLVPVVEVREGGITIKVDGQDRHFQPIGIMPRTQNNNSNGSARLGSIREAIQNQPQGELIRDSKGNIIVTSKSGNVVASAPKQLPMTEPNRSAQTLQINDLEPQEKEQAQKLSKPEFRKTPIYQKMKQTFLSKIGAAKLNGPLAIGYNVSNLKGDNYMFQAFVLPVQQSYDRNSDRLISELFATNDVEAALNSNSRISRAARELKAFFEAFPSADDMSFEQDEQGNIIPTGDTEATLTKLQETLGKKLGNFLNIPSRDGWKYSITPTEKVLPDGRRLFSLSLTSMNGDIIPLGEVTNGTMSPQTQFTILKNLLMDGNTVRMRDNKNSFVVWNVPYIDVQNADNNKRSKDNIADIYDDDILSFSKDSLKYSVNGLAINAPFTMNGEANYFKQDEVSNPSNATQSTSVNTPAIVSQDQVQVKDAVVDSETGATLEGEVKAPVKNSQAEAVVTQIVEDSKNIELLPDNSGYINTKTGKKFARVTSIISADEEAGDRFDPNSPWATPSTNIGTGIDNFVRDFFDGKIDPQDKELSKRYPNATSGDLSRFAQQLEALKNKLNAEGLTIVPRDVTVTGTLKVTDSKGVEHKIDVAGTLDLLAYDGAGNFYVFDMKTNRSGINGHKQEKYTRQLSLYQKFLEENYGVKVKSLQIIPIGVSYPDPKGWRNATAEYDVTKNNQLTLDGNEFRGASPQLQSLIPLNYREPKIIYDKLTDSEKSKIAEKEAKDAAQKILEEQSKEGEKPDVQKVEVEESDKENIDPLTGLPIGKVKSRRRRGGSTRAVSQTPIRLIPSKFTWGSFEGYNSEETKKALEATGMTEEKWNQLSDEEMEHELKCKGMK